MTPTTPRPSHRVALVTGANGYIGLAVCRAFTRAGYTVVGLIRRPEAAADLVLSEATPFVGRLDDLSWVQHTLLKRHPTIHVVVNCLETFPDYRAVARQVVDLASQVGQSSSANGVRTLVLWSSGSKDYGLSPLDRPVDEEYPIDTPIEGPRERALTSLAALEGNPFDTVVLRPTNLFGYSSSYFGTVIKYAADQREMGSASLNVPIDPGTIIHSTHVDDCAEAYVALANHADRAAVAGNIYNISGHRYETVGEIIGALASEYGFPEGASYSVNEAPVHGNYPPGLLLALNFPQWVGSARIRELTGWTDRRMLFSQNIAVHRASYEAEDQRGNDNVQLVRKRMLALDKVDVRRG